MEYQKIINLLENTWNQPFNSKFRARNWVKINYETTGSYNANNDIKVKTSMIRSSLYDYSDVYIYVTYMLKRP